MRNELQSHLAAFDQQHLLDAWDSLSYRQRDVLAEQIRSQDLGLLRKLFQEQTAAPEARATDAKITPMPFQMAQDDSRREYWLAAGETILSQGQAAAFLVAGGQGSRLGFDGPKGAYRIGLPSGKSIFQIQAERLLRLRRLYGKQAPWCIMTSPLNHADTVAHFQENNFFGLDESLIAFFPQAMIPAIDTDGHILRDDAGELALVPDGNGGCFRALSASGSLDWLSSLGVRFVFLYSVDNVLVKVCDPFFMGALACSSEYRSASKVVGKAGPEEKVGIFAYQNGKPSVIEYSDLSTTLRDQRNDDGSLTFDGGNIAVHLFRLEALRLLENQPLPWHAAFKKIPHWTRNGREEPTSPNAWKFEQFLFDSFPILGTMMPFGVERAQEFAPVKNAEGNDSPASARKLLGTLHRRWLTRVGAPVADGMLYEISPLLSYAGEGLDPELFQRELGKGIRSFAE